MPALFILMQTHQYKYAVASFFVYLKHLEILERLRFRAFNENMDDFEFNSHSAQSVRSPDRYA